MDVEKLCQTLAKIIGEREGLEIQLKIERKDDEDGIPMCEIGS